MNRWYIRVSDITHKEINRIVDYLEEQGSSWYGISPVNPYDYDSNLYFIEFKPSFYLLKKFRDDLKYKLNISEKPFLYIYEDYELIEKRELGVEVWYIIIIEIIGA